MDEASSTSTPDLSGHGGEEQTFVTFLVAAQRLGVPAQCVRDILVRERIARVPGAPAAVRGRINLRGRIATVVDMRARLELPVRGDAKLGMGVTVEHRGELYTASAISCARRRVPRMTSRRRSVPRGGAWRAASIATVLWPRSTSTGCSTSPERSRRISYSRRGLQRAT